VNTFAQAGGPLQPYDSKSQGWTRQEATHLLWRTQFGASFEEIGQAADDGLEKTLDRLLTPQAESAEFESANRLLRQNAFDTGNIDNLKAWWLYRMLNSANPLVEKMTLFWHNHFATSNAKVQSVEHMAVQNDLIRRAAVGNFRELLSGMTRDVAMLIWLDGNANRKRHANENFAREVMELFSLDVGNYTEIDIQEAARAFTGWHVREDQFWFNKRQHDVGEKTVFGKTGNFNGDDIIKLCLDQAACPEFLATKMLHSFVMPNPDKKAIGRLAGRIHALEFQMTPVLRELFGSRLFFDAASRNSLIKSPLELVLGSYRALGSEARLAETVRLLADLGQDVFEPPTVKGWDGGRLWISSASVLQRANFAAELTSGDRYGAIDDPSVVTQSHDWSTPGDVVLHYANLLLGRDVNDAVLARLEKCLRDSQGDRSTRIRGLLHVITTMPEYQLI